jgi:hypothetical protein
MQTFLIIFLILLWISIPIIFRFLYLWDRDKNGGKLDEIILPMSFFTTVAPFIMIPFGILVLITVGIFKLIDKLYEKLIA